MTTAAAPRERQREDAGMPEKRTYTQITNFTDSATAPTLSPDGRMVAFIRSDDWFLTSGVLGQGTRQSRKEPGFVRARSSSWREVTSQGSKPS